MHSGVSMVGHVGQVPWAQFEGGGGGGPLNMFVFDICFPIEIFNGLDQKRNSPTFQL